VEGSHSSHTNEGVAGNGDSVFHDVALDVAAQDRGDRQLDGIHNAVDHRKEAFKKLSIVHVTSGVLSVSLASATVAVRSADATYASYEFMTLSPGIWCGLVYLVCFVFTRFVSSRKNAGAVTIAWCSAAFSTAFACSMMCLDLSTFIVLLDDRGCCVNSKTPLVIMHLVLSVVAAVEVIVSTVTCGFCCRVYCCLPEQSLHYKAAIYSVFKERDQTGAEPPRRAAVTSTQSAELPVDSGHDHRITSTSSFELSRVP